MFLLLVLLILATFFTGLLAGISLDKAVVQLPARRRLGEITFAAFSRANDLGNGLVLYSALGIGSAFLTIVAGIFTWVDKVPLSTAWPLYCGVALAILHSFATSRAAPQMLRLRQPALSEEQIKASLDLFTTWHSIRAVLQCLDFAFLLWALIALIHFSKGIPL